MPICGLYKRNRIKNKYICLFFLNLFCKNALCILTNEEILVISEVIFSNRRAPCIGFSLPRIKECLAVARSQAKVY